MVPEYNNETPQQLGSVFEPIPTVPKRAQGKPDIWPRKREDFSSQVIKLWELSDTFSFSSTWAVSHFNKFMVMNNTFSAYFIGKIFCRAVHIHRNLPVALNVYLPSVLGSVSFFCFVKFFKIF